MIKTNEKITIVYYNDIQKEIEVKEGAKSDYFKLGYLSKPIFFEKVYCHYGKTANFSTLVNELKEKYNAIIHPSTARIMALTND